MSKKIDLQELELFENEIIESFQNLVKSSTVLKNLHSLVLDKAQDAINSANVTDSYDKKVDSLVKGIQDVVTIVGDAKKHVDLATEKHRSDIELISQLKVRFNEVGSMEKTQQTNLPDDV